MQSSRPLGALVLVVGLLAACDSPTEPDPRIPSATGRPTRLAVTAWHFGARTTSVRIQAIWGDLYRTERDVTNEATLHSSDSAVMRIARSGQVESVAPGEATLTITFRDISISEVMRVYPGESPLPVIACDPKSCYVSDTIYDATTSGLNRTRLEGVLVEIISGHNAGMTSRTDRHGWYYFYPPFVCGPITARASKSGYRDRVGSSVMCENGMPDLSLTPLK